MPVEKNFRFRQLTYKTPLSKIKAASDRKSNKADDNATSIEQEKEAKIGQKKGIGIYYRYSSMEKSRTCVI